MQAPESNYNAPPFPPFPAASRYIPLGPVKEAMDRVCRSVDAMDAISMIIGPPGTGKSMLCSLIAQRYAETHEVVMLGEIPATTRGEFLAHLLHRLGIDITDMRESNMQIALMDHVCSDDSIPGGVLMIIDEAQAMPREVMEAVRTVTNISRTGEPRIFAVMSGGAKVDEVLAEPSMEAFTQRVATRCYLHPMNGDETRRYISETIAACGADSDETITAEAIAAIHHACCGVPRLINQMMTQAIDCAADSEQTLITEQIIDKAWAELQQLPSPMIDEPKISSETNSAVEFGELSDFGEPSTFDSLPQNQQSGGRCESADLNDSLDFAEPMSCQKPSLGCVVNEIGLEQSGASWVEEPVAEVMPENPPAPAAGSLFGEFDEEETIEVSSRAVRTAVPNGQSRSTQAHSFPTASPQVAPTSHAAPMNTARMPQQEILNIASMGHAACCNGSAESTVQCSDSVLKVPSQSEAESAPTQQNLGQQGSVQEACQENVIRIHDDSDILVIEDEIELRADAATDASESGSRPAVALDFQSMLGRMRSQA